MKMLVARIGYTEYALEEEDAILLLGIATRACKLQFAPNGAYVVDPDNSEAFIDTIRMLEVQFCDDPALSQEPPPSKRDDEMPY